jgi:hypothetical protein
MSYREGICNFWLVALFLICRLYLLLNIGDVTILHQCFQGSWFLTVIWANFTS